MSVWDSAKTEKVFGILDMGCADKGKNNRICLNKKQVKTPDEVMKHLGTFLKQNSQGVPADLAMEGHPSLVWEDTYKYFYACGLDGYLTHFDKCGRISLLHAIKHSLAKSFGVEGKRFFAWWFFSTGGNNEHHWVWRDAVFWHEVYGDWEGDSRAKWDGTINMSCRSAGKGAIAGKGKWASSHKFQDKAGEHRRSGEQKYRRSQK